MSTFIHNCYGPLQCTLLNMPIYQKLTTMLVACKPTLIAVSEVVK